MLIPKLLVGSLFVFSTTLALAEHHSTSLKDGQVQFPQGYTEWPAFKLGIEKPSGHIRDIYINNVANNVVEGGKFPYGSESVMEIYKASSSDSGLVKQDLEKVYVMKKVKGGEAQAPAGLATGDWIFAAYAPDGSPLKVDYTGCRGCHLPHEQTDYIFHYEDFFARRASASK